VAGDKRKNIDEDVTKALKQRPGKGTAAPLKKKGPPHRPHLLPFHRVSHVDSKLCAQGTTPSARLEATRAKARFVLAINLVKEMQAPTLTSAPPGRQPLAVGRVRDAHGRGRACSRAAEHAASAATTTAAAGGGGAGGGGSAGGLSEEEGGAGGIQPAQRGG
jgi:hypothetical protein